MSTWFCSSGRYAAVAQWAASTAFSVGDLRRQLATPSIGSERVFRCTTAGTSGAAEPSWSLTKGSTTADGTVTWTEVTGNSAYGWGAALATMATLASWMAAGDTAFVGDDHAESNPITTSAIWTFPGSAINPNFIFCMDHLAASPGLANLKISANAIGTGSGNFNLIIQGSFYCYGLTFLCSIGAAAATASLQFANGNGNQQIYESCTLGIANATNSRQIITYGTLVLINSKFKFGLNNQALALNGVLYCYGLSFDTSVSGNMSGVLEAVAATQTFWYCENCDFTGITGKLVANPVAYGACFYQFKRCKFDAGMTALVSPQSGGWQGNHAEFYQCDSGAGIGRNERYMSVGSSVVVTSLARTGGASDNGVPISRQILTPAATSFLFPFNDFFLVIWNPTAGAAVNVTIEFICDPRDFSALPNNDQVWFDVEYLGTSGSTLGSTMSGTKSNVLDTGAALSPSTAAWDGATAARGNSSVYNAGDQIKTASNSGRVFVCTTAGTSAAAEPAGYASAVDGGAVADGTAVFTAMLRCKQTLTITPQYAGVLYATPKVAASSVAGGVYMDPLITLH